MSLHQFLLSQFLYLANDLRCALILQVGAKPWQLGHRLSFQHSLISMVASCQIYVDRTIHQATRSRGRRHLILWKLFLPSNEGVAQWLWYLFSMAPIISRNLLLLMMSLRIVIWSMAIWKHWHVALRQSWWQNIWWFNAIDIVLFWF